MTSPDVQAAFVETLVDEWVRAGTTDAVVAPGSRSTPLLLALDAHPKVRVHVVLDERSAGFVALGIGAATGRPAPVVTTSGTAAVELHPAVVEAHHAGVPLLAVTADRPPELHHVSAPQTIDQDGLFGGVVRFAAAPGVAVAKMASSWRSLASRAWASAVSGPLGPGPVHLNLAFREPLLPLDQEAVAALVPPGRPDGAPWHRVAGDSAAGGGVSAVVPSALVGELASGTGRGMIVAGAGCGDPGAVLGLAASLGWPVLADPCSGCRVPHPSVVATADSLLRTPVVSGWQPDVVLRLGRPWSSKVVGGWLAGLPARTRQILVDPRAQWADPDGQVAEVLAVDPTALCQAVLAARTPPPAEERREVSGWRRWLRRRPEPPRAPEQPAAKPSEWLARWQHAEQVASGALAERLGAEGLSEPGIARTVVAAVPDGATVVAASSMPVRDLEWFSTPRRGVRTLANRGANGIDGVVSTTLGVALAAGAGTHLDGVGDPPVVGVVGDLAFLHDAGALLWAQQRRLRCILVVVDNNGGGIFSFLPQADREGEGERQRFERLWGTPHGLDLQAVASAYEVPSQVVGDVDELTGALAAPDPGVRVVIARTPRDENVKLHDRLHAAVADAVAATFS